jgi:hypothetical protein
MKRYASLFAVLMIGGGFLPVNSESVQAGRIGGPLWTVATVPPFQVIYFDVAFADGDTAVVSIGGTGRTELDLLIFDGDGNVAMGTGTGDQKRASMYVYRTGFFRVEIRNRGPFANTFLLSTN